MAFGTMDRHLLGLLAVNNMFDVAFHNHSCALVVWGEVSQNVVVTNSYAGSTK